MPYTMPRLYSHPLYWLLLALFAGHCSASLSAHTLSSSLGYEAPQPGTYHLPVIKPAIDGEVLDTAGRAHRLFAYLDDKVVLLSFMYTRCSDAHGCPLALGVFRTLAEELQHEPHLARQVRLLTLSFDPAHDTPQVMQQYAAASKPNAISWDHLTTASPRALQPLLDGYGQYIAPVLNARQQGTGYSHLLKVFLIDRQRQVRNIYSVDFLHPAILLNDIKTLLLADAPAR